MSRFSFLLLQVITPARESHGESIDVFPSAISSLKSGRRKITLPRLISSCPLQKVDHRHSDGDGTIFRLQYIMFHKDGSGDTDAGGISAAGGYKYPDVFVHRVLHLFFFLERNEIWGFFRL